MHTYRSLSTRSAFDSAFCSTRNEYRPIAIAVAIARPAAKKSEYQMIDPENEASGQWRRMKIAVSSVAGSSSKKERMRAATPVTTARRDLAVLGRIGSVISCPSTIVVTSHCTQSARRMVVEKSNYTQNSEQATPKEAADRREISFAGLAIANAPSSSLPAERLGA